MADAPNYAGGYAGEATVTGGGGYDPYAPENYTGPIAPTYDPRGGYVPGQVESTNGGYDPNAANRDVGASEQTTKPDGTPIEPGATPSNISKGNAVPGAAAITEGATVVPDILKSKSVNPSKQNASNLVKNPLEQFASMTPLWTLAVLTKEQYNDPASYRNNPGDLKHIVFSSAGRFDKPQRQSTYYATPEYYVDNFIMTSIIAPTKKSGNSNATKFDFDIFEQYSMGLFLQSLQAAAVAANYANYLNNAPYVLRLDFQGYDDNAAPVSSVKSKFFIMRFTNVSFSVTESGSLYKVEGVPYNEMGFNSNIDTTYNDLTLVPGPKNTVEELLNSGPQSLAAGLNDIEKKLKDSGRIRVPDKYIIEFPEKSSDFTPSEIPKVESRATTDPNDPISTFVKGKTAPVETKFTVNKLGSSQFIFDQSSGGNFPFPYAGDVYDDKTGLIQRYKMAIDPKKRTFFFAQSQKLSHIINQVMLATDFARSAMLTQNMVNGFIQWWRVDVQIELSEYDDLVGDYARIFRYRVCPFNVHHTIFSNVNAAPIGYEALKPRICKEYNYIYTGQNSDIIKFDIQLDNAFYKAISSSPENISGKNSDPNQAGATQPSTKTTAMGEGQTPSMQTTNTLRARSFKDPNVLSGYKGGSGNAGNTEQRVAEQFHRAFLEGYDMITVNLEILGDTYWMIQSGQGNYFSPAVYEGALINEDGSLNYEDGDMFVSLKFRTPVDVDTTDPRAGKDANGTGTYTYAGGGGSESEFSGIYRVVQCETRCSDGLFKQVLECLRMPGQAIDFKPGEKVVEDKATSPAITIGPDGTPNTSLSAYPNYNAGIKPNSSTANGTDKPVPATSPTVSPDATPGQLAPDFRGGYVPGSVSVAGGGGYDPATGTFASNSANSIGGSAAISDPYSIAPSFAGGYVPGAGSVASGGGYDPITGTNTSDSANSIGGSAAIT